jgi:hypothetical protein
VVLGLQCGAHLSHLANDNHQGLDGQGHPDFERGRRREAGVQVDPEHLPTTHGAPLAVTQELCTSPPLPTHTPRAVGYPVQFVRKDES